MKWNGRLQRNAGNAGNAVCVGCVQRGRWTGLAFLPTPLHVEAVFIAGHVMSSQARQSRPTPAGQAGSSLLKTP